MTAIISECQRYRYRLDRDIATPDSKTIAFFGINPSIADEDIDDPTIKKIKGFASRHGGSKVIVGNVFAFRTPHVHELELMLDPVGPENRYHHQRIIEEADILVPCWGGRYKVPQPLRHHFEDVLQQLQASGKPVQCLGLTVDGDPKHSLFIPYTTSLMQL